jgi:hypothetical protein
MREITGKYEIKTVIKHAHTLSLDTKGSENFMQQIYPTK